jgi:hypothetical protein
LFVDSSGNIGIATSTPNTSGYGGSVLGIFGSGNNGGNIWLTSETTAAGNRTGRIGFGTEGNTVNKETARIWSLVDGSTAGNLGGNLLFNTKSDGGALTERMRLDSSGRLGLGTSSPGAKLESYFSSTDPSLSSNTGAGLSVNGTSTVRLNFGNYPGSPFSSWVQSSDGAGTAYPIALNPLGGNVGIGTNSPRFALSIGSAVAVSTATPDTLDLGATFSPTPGANPKLRIYEDAISPYGFGVTNSQLEYICPTSASHVFFTAGTEKARIDSSGNVGIGTTSPGFLITAATSADGVDGVSVESPSVNGIIRLRADGTNGNAIRVGGVGAQGNTLRFLVGSDTERMRIDSSGRLLVGTSTARANLFNSTGSPRLQVESTGSDNSSIGLTTNFTTATPTAAPILALSRSGATTLGSSTLVADGNWLGSIQFLGADGSEFVTAAQILGQVDGTPGANDMPGRLVFSVTADGAASPTEALRISNDRSITVSDGGNVVLGTTTGTKIGTGTTQKIGFYNATPVVQPTAVADATDAATVITQLNALLAKLRTLGIIAT